MAIVWRDYRSDVSLDASEITLDTWCAFCVVAFNHHEEILAGIADSKESSGSPHALLMVSTLLSVIRRYTRFGGRATIEVRSFLAHCVPFWHKQETECTHEVSYKVGSLNYRAHRGSKGRTRCFEFIGPWRGTPSLDLRNAVFEMICSLGFVDPYYVISEFSRFENYALGRVGGSDRLSSLLAAAHTFRDAGKTFLAAFEDFIVEASAYQVQRTALQFSK